MKTIDRYSWSDVDRLVRQLARQIDKPFDVIVCILRGGAIPGVILANELGIDTVIGLKIVQQGQTSAATADLVPYRGLEAIVTVPLNPVSLRDKRVLLVDDVLDSGETALAALREIRELGPSTVEFATMQVKTYSSFKPHFFVEERENWLFYPWMSEREFEQMTARLATRSERA